MDKEHLESGAARPASTLTSAASTQTLHWLAMVRKVVVIFGVMNAIVLGSVAVVAATGGEANTFMWVRAGLLLALTPLLYRWSSKVEHGSSEAFQRLLRVSIVLPIALVAVDFIPGVCPRWYAWLQVCVAITLVAVAGLLSRRDVKVLFAGGA